LSEEQKEFIRDQIKQVLLEEVAASKVWGKIPSVQATFQLETGNLISLVLTFHNYSVHVKKRRRRSRRKTNKTCFWWYLFSALV
jgi:hypothetical protein